MRTHNGIISYQLDDWIIWGPIVKQFIISREDLKKNMLLSYF